MKIHNFRVGFATNSSSSHSVVMIPADAVGKVSDKETYGSNKFGWEWFRLSSAEAKLRYLAAQMFATLPYPYLDPKETDEEKIAQHKRVLAENNALMDKIMERFDREIPGYADEIRNSRDNAERGSWWDRPSVDHQSVYQIDSKAMKEETLTELIEYFKSPRVVVVGGNDNSDDEVSEHMPAGVDFEVVEAFSALMTDDSRNPLRVRSDGQYWTVFNPARGTKARLSLEPDLPDYTKAKAPELVDLKITDYCGRGCKFCYQSSTTAGKHASLEEITRVLDMMAAMDVFEVAIGGGEPTDHPQFAEIIEACAARKIKPNFTTLSGDWLDNERVVAAVKKHVGGIGVSCSDQKALALVETIKTALDANYYWDNPKITVQHVVGSVPITVTAELLEKAFNNSIPVLLLGYKEVGFGAQYERHDDHNTPLALKLAIDQATVERRYPSVSVDTALVDQYPDFIEALGVPDALVTSPEGKFSCYVDAVEGLMGPSSYIEKTQMEPVAESVDDFVAKFAAY